MSEATKHICNDLIAVTVLRSGVLCCLQLLENRWICFSGLNKVTEMAMRTCMVARGMKTPLPLAHIGAVDGTADAICTHTLANLQPHFKS